MHSMEYYLATKRNKLLIHTTTGLGVKSTILEQKKLVSKSYMLYDSTYIMFSK